MKKMIALLLALLAAGALVACGGASTSSVAPTVSPSTETGSTSSQKDSSTPGASTVTPSVPTSSQESGTTTGTPSPATETLTPATPSTPTPTSTLTPTPVEEKIVAVYKSGDDEIKAEGTDSVVLKPTKRPVAGDTITVTAPTNYLKVKHSKLGETILYLPDKVFTYVHQSNASVYMSSLVVNKALTLTFSTPTKEELATKRNLALNPYDFTKGNVGFPHATSNNVYDQSGQFIPRNAIDGVATNKGHGNTPYQSWGPKATVLKTDYFTIDFGRAVTMDSVVLYLRADGFGGSNSHDAYFKEITLEFSDGSSVTINPTKTADAQTFDFDAVTTTYVKLTGFVTDKTDSQGWAAITEIQVMGCEAVGNE